MSLVPRQLRRPGNQPARPAYQRRAALSSSPRLDRLPRVRNPSSWSPKNRRRNGRRSAHPPRRLRRRPFLRHPRPVMHPSSLPVQRLHRTSDPSVRPSRPQQSDLLEHKPLCRPYRSHRLRPSSFPASLSTRRTRARLRQYAARPRPSPKLCSKPTSQRSTPHRGTTCSIRSSSVWSTFGRAP